MGDKTGLGLLAVNRQIRREAMSITYRSKPLRVEYDGFDLHVADTSYINYEDTERRLVNNIYADPGRRLLESDAVRYVCDIEIIVDMYLQSSSLEGPNAYLKRFIKPLDTDPMKRMRRFRIELSGDDDLDSDDNRIRLFGLLLHFSRSPGFADVTLDGLPDEVAIGERFKRTMMPGKKRTFEEYAGDGLSWENLLIGLVAIFFCQR